MLVSVFNGYFWEISRNPGVLHFLFLLAGCIPSIPTSLVFSMFGQCCVSESLKLSSAKIGSVPASCVAASLALPAPSASGT